jgi:hypothetical protein
MPEIERSLRVKLLEHRTKVSNRFLHYSLMSLDPLELTSMMEVTEKTWDFAVQPIGLYGGDARKHSRWRGNSGRKPGSLKLWVCQKPHRAREHHTHE